MSLLVPKKLPLIRSAPQPAGLAPTALLLLLVAPVFVACQPAPAIQNARTLIRQGHYDAAQREIRQGLAADPQNESFWQLRIQLHLDQQQVQQAVAVYQEHERRYGEDQHLLRFLALSILRWGLKQHDPQLRLAALHGARRTDATELERDVAARLHDPDELVRTWAAVALSQTREGVDMLEQQLQSPRPAARALALRTMGKYGGKAVLPTMKNFVTDPSAEVRAGLAEALALTADVEALPLLKTLLSDADHTVRTAAAKAVGTLRLPEGARLVRQAAIDPYLGTRLAAVLALAQLNAKDARADLLTLAQSEDLLIALRAGVQLAKLGEAQPGLNAIAKALVDHQWPIRAAGCNAVASMDDDVALRLLRRAVNDPVLKVRLAAARVQLSSGDKASAIRIARTVTPTTCPSSATEQGLCQEAAEILARAGDTAGMTTLKRLARKSSDPTVRLDALVVALRQERDMFLAVQALADKATTVAIEAAVWIVRALG